MFKSELEFEKEIIKLLQNRGWDKNVLHNKTEKELLDNWANILYNNIKDIDRLNNCPLTEGEKYQLLEQIKKARTPFNINKIINGKTIAIKRDNPNDKNHFGKEVSLEIYDRDQIAGGKSFYQIVEQPVFSSKSSMLNDRRGDLLLLINGMPVIHIELKRTGIPVSNAINQIKKYHFEGVFTGLFSLVQIFVAMTPEKTLYFANPGGYEKFNEKFFFRWADFNNEEYKSWDKIIEHLLSIPMAHKLIGFYTVPDDGDGILKVLRSYQYHAVEAINNRVDKAQWTSNDKLGGYICHTTGSGKTLTSFKAAQLLAGSGKANKVVFLVDRIELGIQSAREYHNFKSDNEEIQQTESTEVLLSKLKSDSINDNLIITSIQKMSNITLDEGVNKRDIERINRKKIVFIIDECHRSTFGTMLADIKFSFPTALYFGFTGTPIYEDNEKKMNTTNTIFGAELHRYSIADGIRDGNVLGFDPSMVLTIKDKDLREAVALERAKAKSIAEVNESETKSKIFYKFYNDTPMAGFKDDLGNYHKGIEDYVSSSQYERNESKSIEEQHQYYVVKHILENWDKTSRNKFHAIFATSSIQEACEYYSLFKSLMGKDGLPLIKIAGIFDENIGDNERSIPKEKALIELLNDYNKLFNQNFSIPRYSFYKKDVALRLAHKERYIGIENKPSEILNLVIVVDQMLTGFDSKWVNTLYLDKKMRFENIVQAFSRTNRIIDSHKTNGVIKYYRYCHTMERNINDAFNLYSGNRPYGIFVEKLEGNLNIINTLFLQIKRLFDENGITNFSKNPDIKEERAKFASLFSTLVKYIEASSIQGFTWKKEKYDFFHEKNHTSITILFNEITYKILALRYKELFSSCSNPRGNEDAPYDLDSTAIEIDTEKINADYMNRKFQKYIKVLQEDSDDAHLVNKVLEELHNTFSSLNQEEQRLAEMILTDIQSGLLHIDINNTFRDYINQYGVQKKNDQIHKFAIAIGVDENLLRELVRLRPSSSNINEFAKFDNLIKTLDCTIAKTYIVLKEQKEIPDILVKIKAENEIRSFILQGGFDI